MATNGDEWLTVRDAALLSGYSQEYIRRLMRKGILSAKKFSIIWQVNRQSLMDYVATARESTDKRYTPKIAKR